MLSDEIVSDAKQRVCAAIDKHMEAPLRLLKEFEDFAGLMNGGEEARVSVVYGGLGSVDPEGGEII